MKNALLVSCAVLLGVLAMGGPAAAHHGVQGYDHSKKLTLKGTVSEFSWTNPHLKSFLVRREEGATRPHGGQGYDHSKKLTLKGTVSEFSWTNPHAQIYLDAKDESGTMAHWGLELNSPGNLVKLGWEHTSLKTGD